MGNSHTRQDAKLAKSAKKEPLGDVASLGALGSLGVLAHPYTFLNLRRVNV
jgi:hypothetical protein